jgi:hypothetical protein
MFAEDYRAEEEPRLVRIPAAKYLTLKPRARLTDSHLVDQMQLLYDVSFAVKTNCRQENPRYRPYALMMAELLTWGQDPGVYFVTRARVDWNWLLLVRTPAFVGQQDLDAGLNALKNQGKTFKPGDAKLQVLDEGECVQTLFKGDKSSDDMQVAIRAKRFAKVHERVLTGVQHEIFVTNILHVRPVIRQAVFRYPVCLEGEEVRIGPQFK